MTGEEGVEEQQMPVRHKAGSKPYRNQLRADLARLRVRGQQLTELIARDLQQQGVRAAAGMAVCR